MNIQIPPGRNGHMQNNICSFLELETIADTWQAACVKRLSERLWVVRKGSELFGRIQKCPEVSRMFWNDRDFFLMSLKVAEFYIFGDTLPISDPLVSTPGVMNETS